MRSRRIINFLGCLIFVTHLSLSYYYFGHCWNSSLGTVLIVFLCFVIWGKNFKFYAGLKVNLQSFLLAALLGSFLVVVSFLVMKNMAATNGMEIIKTNWKNYYHICFYVLNEELVFGSLILLPLVKNTKVEPVVFSIGLALVFSFGHYIFYRWVFLDRGIMELLALLVLFFVGILRNNLILTTGHIAYSWALHFGWMVVMFGCNHISVQNKSGLSELARFNLYLGSTAVLVVSFLLAVGSLFFMSRKRLDYLRK